MPTARNRWHPLSPERFACGGDGRFFDALLAIDVFEHIDDYLGSTRRSKTKRELKSSIFVQLFCCLLCFGAPADLWEQVRLMAIPHDFFKATASATLRILLT